jgi:hypothetical protein
MVEWSAERCLLIRSPHFVCSRADAFRQRTAFSRPAFAGAGKELRALTSHTGAA